MPVTAPARVVRRFFLPAYMLGAPKHRRHVGFLSFSRRTLAAGAIAACATMTVINALPAKAEVVQQEVRTSASQSFTAPSMAATPVLRDGFEIIQYSMVQWPLPSTTRMSSDFGLRSCAGCSRDHKGIDLTPGAGYPIQAIADGVVSQVGNPSGSFGVFVVIDHVVDGQAVRSLYGHMQLGSLSLNVGDVVARGEIVGAVGNTGSSTGPHLHFGIEIDGVFVDPLAWLLAHANA